MDRQVYEARVSILARPEGRALPRTPHARTGARGCFNPRPARRPGATGVLRRRDAALLDEFQSSPGPKAGRYGAGMGAGEPGGTSFNPRPARRPGATNVRTVDLDAAIEFQSSPGPKAGRYGRSPSRQSGASAFQSSPGPKAGRYWGPVDYRISRDQFQSSPGPKAGRYRTSSRPSRMFRNRFNPRPARRPGATPPIPPAAPLPRRVSILARPEGRALPPGRKRSSPSWSSFNPRPARRPGATGSRVTCQEVFGGFNPRPARRPGAT